MKIIVYLLSCIFIQSVYAQNNETNDDYQTRFFMDVQIEFSMNEAVVDVKESENDIFNPEIYPVPSDKFITVKFFSIEETNADLMIYNTLGNNLGSMDINVAKGDNLSRLNVSDLVPGAYYLRIKIGETIQTKAFQIIR